MKIDSNGTRHFEEAERPVDFRAVRDLLQGIQREAAIALEEVLKDVPDETRLCIHGIEKVEELLDGIKDHVLPCYDGTIYGTL